MARWLAKTDGAGGDFIKDNWDPDHPKPFVLTTASGKKLGEGDGSQGPENALRAGFTEWNRLSTAEHTALPAGKEIHPPQVSRCSPPPDGLVVAVFVRQLKRDSSGSLSRIAPIELRQQDLYPHWYAWMTQPAHTNLWLTKAEWQSLLPARLVKGETYPVPAAIRKRVFRFHLVDNTFGLPVPWKPDQIRAGELNLTVEETSPMVRLRLYGSALLTTQPDPDQSKHGYDAKLTGVLEYDPARKRFTRFDVVALGDCWGGDYEGGRFKRPGRTPLGVAFRLTAGENAIDRVPPLVHMDLKSDYDDYFGK
jgi:hypothetical protein